MKTLTAIIFTVILTACSGGEDCETDTGALGGAVSGAINAISGATAGTVISNQADTDTK